METTLPAGEKLRGSEWTLVDGRKVVVLEKRGDAWKVVNDRGRLELAYPRQFKADQE